MDLQDVCQKIFEYAQVANASSDELIAYINIEVGQNFPFSDADVIAAFHRLVWDTDFSSADLNIEHTSTLRANEIAVVSLSCFIRHCLQGKCLSVWRPQSQIQAASAA